MSDRYAATRSLVAPLLVIATVIAMISGATDAAPAADVAEPALESLGVSIPGVGVPSTNMWGTLLYGEAVVPGEGEKVGPFFVYDVERREVIYSGEDDIHTGFRTIAVDDDGNAYFSVNVTGLARYSPATNSVDVLPVTLSASLRAATRRAADGWIYGATNRGDDRIFRFQPETNTIEDLGPAWGYTTSMVLDPSERYLYFIPDAHGGAYRSGTPIVRHDTRTNEQSVVAFLNSFYEERYGFRLGGTYALDIDPSGERLYINMNAVDLSAEPGADSGFGDPAVFVVHLPQEDESPPPPAPFRFTEVSGETGIADLLEDAYLHSSSWGDVDGDGWLDLFAGTFVQGPAVQPSRLLLNRRGRFVDADQPAVALRGRATGSALVDLDEDGDPDLVISHNRIKGQSGPSDERSRLLRNDDGVFVDVTAGSGLEHQDTNGRQVGVLDYDGDGDLDLFIVADALRGRGRSVLLRNDGDLHFTDATADAGLPDDVNGLGLAIADVTGNGWPDIFVAGGPKDAGHRNYLFMADGGGFYHRADDTTLDWAPFVHGDEDWVSGGDFGDVNRDGRLDLLVAHHFGTAAERGDGAAVRLFLNRGLDREGDPIFEDVTDAACLPKIRSKAPHAEIQDIDNDGWPDLFVSVTLDGADTPTPLVYRHLGLEGDVPRFDAPSFDETTYYVGGHLADYDRDGRLDAFLADWRAVLVGTPDGAPRQGSLLLRNETESGHWLTVRVAVDGISSGVGTRVLVYEAGRAGDPDALLGADEITASDGFSGSSHPEVHFGLGTVSVVDVVAHLPFGGATIDALAVPADRMLTLPLGTDEPAPHLGLASTAVRDRSERFLEPPIGVELPPHSVASTPPTVDFVPFDRPDYDGNPWSQWGAGLFASDGRFYAAIGDHLGVDGNAYLYAYDPATRRLVCIGDTLSAVGHVEGAWGHGKIHSRITEGRDGYIYMTSYWGSMRGLVLDDDYLGSVVLRYPLRSGGGTGVVPPPAPTPAEPTATSITPTATPEALPSPEAGVHLPWVGAD